MCIYIYKLINMYNHAQILSVGKSSWRFCYLTGKTPRTFFSHT